MSKSKTLTSNAAPEIRSIFSSNLRQLCDNYGPISQLSSELGINRTQFNRYLSGNSFPRPDVLFRICKFFGLDARILLEPLDSLQVRCSNIMFHSDLEEFFHSATDLASQSLPTGFYKFIRGSFIYDDLFTCGLFKVYQKDGCTFVRGFEPKEVFIKQGLPCSRDRREFRGLFMTHGNGVAMLSSYKMSKTRIFTVLSSAPNVEKQFWFGFAALARDQSPVANRITRFVAEALENDFSEILSVARNQGYIEIDDVPPYHRQLLQLDSPIR